ncbi:MAG TPA: hypothetical protein VE909_11865 [Xanthobacteraceae bacterium]|nr:hypothetical protein [Xanthobacteraceae bacterium]
MLARIHLDCDGNGIAIEHVQDVASILERNKALRGAAQKSDWGRHIATIPNVILVRWMNEEGVNVLAMSGEEFGAFIRKKLNDPDWRHLRTDR